MKRIISFILTTVFLFYLLPVVPSQAASVTYAVTGGNITISESGTVLSCDKTVTEAVIPACVEGITVTTIGSYAFRNCTALESVVLPEGLTAVYSYAFQGCSKLSRVEFPSTLKSLPEYAFASCGFTTVSLKYIEQIGRDCFYNCRSLKTVSFDSVKTINREAFMNCYELTYVTFPETLTYIWDKAFYDTSIRSIVLPASISYVGADAFGLNIDLTRVTVLNPGCRYSVYDQTYEWSEVFHGLTSTKISFHGEENSSLREYAEQFGHNYTSHSFNEDDVCTICGAEPYTFDDGLWSYDSRTGVAYIYGCGQTAAYTALYPYYDWRFYNSCITNIVFGNDVRKIEADAFADMYMVEQINLVNVETIGTGAFKNCTSLERLYTPDTLVTINSCAFENCTGLLSVVLRPSVKRVDANAFRGCTSLTSTTVLNPECSLVGELGVSTYNTIYGFIPSTAYDFANQYGHPFCELNGCEYGYHNYALLSETAADCLTDGKRVYQCQNCTESYEKAVPATGHSYESVITEPSCTDGGYTTHTCQNCGGSYISDLTDALGHCYDAITKESSCTDGGYTTYTCQNCGGSYISDLTDALGHCYDAITKEPSCTEGGYTEYCCVDCGDRYTTDQTAPLNHSYLDGVCTTCGTADPSYSPQEIVFSDIPSGSWYKKSVDFAVRNGLMLGTGNGRFEPNTPTTRAMLVTVLWRYVGKPLEGKNSFRDVPMGRWYTDAVAWASYSSIVTGFTDGTFRPTENITREQLVTILYRYCRSNGIDTSSRTDLSVFPDSQNVSSYAKEALSWAVSVGLVNGTKQGGALYLDPKGAATRAQVASILMRFIENIAQ